MAHKIAIIEDDPAILQMYRLKFEAEGFTVKTATNGALGLELLKDFQPDVVLLDMMMPQMGGAEMLTKFRQTDHGKTTKVFLFTNIGAEEVPPEMKKLNVSGLILKAYHTPAQVVEKIQSVLS
ncbi:MAG: response regulator [Candidatus Saccharibacteria bacterium]